MICRKSIIRDQEVERLNVMLHRMINELNIAVMSGRIGYGKVTWI